AVSPSGSDGHAIGLTVQVTNNGTGIARNVALNVFLSADAGTSRALHAFPTRRSSDLAIAGGTLSCGPSDLAGGASYTVHVSSPNIARTHVSTPVTYRARIPTTTGKYETASASVEVLGAAIDVPKSADNPSSSARAAIA